MFTRDLIEATAQAIAHRQSRGEQWGRLGRITETLYGARVVKMNNRDRDGAPLYRVDRYIVTKDPLFDMDRPATFWTAKANTWEVETADAHGNPVVF